LKWQKKEDIPIADMMQEQHEYRDC